MTTAITLKHPIVSGEKTITSVTFKRAKVKDIEAINSAVETEGEFSASITTIARLTGLTLDEVREIDGEDFINLAAGVPDFLPRTATGAPGAP